MRVLCWHRLSVVAASVLLTLAGCGPSLELDAAYGQRQGPGARSVNGTSVLSDIFVRAGARVLTWRSLSPQLARCDVIVWAPDDFGPPSKEVLDFVDRWCAAESGKTFVYIGRDYDAAPHYWQQVAVAAPDAERVELQRRAALAAAQYDCARLAMPAQYSNPWFDMRRDRPPRRVAQLAGPWSAGLDAGEADIRLRGCLAIPGGTADASAGAGGPDAGATGLNHEVLLSDGQQPLVTRVTAPGWGASQVIIVTNGSFLLNLPLANPAHRVLASRLVQTCSQLGRVAFLESGRGGPRTFELETATESPATRPERALVAVQWLVFGVVYCLSIFPIFGRARPLPEEHPAQFIQHVDALAELLEKSQDLAFAQRQIQLYESATRRETSPAVPGSTAAVSRELAAASPQLSLRPKETP